MNILVIATTPHVDNVALDTHTAILSFSSSYGCWDTLIFVDYLPSLPLGCSVVSLQRLVVGKGMFSETSEDKLYVLRAS